MSPERVRGHQRLLKSASWPISQDVERRSEPRFESNQPATATLLTDVEVIFPASLVNVSGRGMCIRTGSALPLSAPVRIDVKDQLYLGEVCFCSAAGQGEYTIGIRLEHVLYDVSGLAQLAQHLIDDTPALKSKLRSLEIPDARE